MPYWPCRGGRATLAGPGRCHSGNSVPYWVTLCWPCHGGHAMVMIRCRTRSCPGGHAVVAMPCQCHSSNLVPCWVTPWWPCCVGHALMLIQCHTGSCHGDWAMVAMPRWPCHAMLVPQRQFGAALGHATLAVPCWPCHDGDTVLYRVMPWWLGHVGHAVPCQCHIGISVPYWVTLRWPCCGGHAMMVIRWHTRSCHDGHATLAVPCYASATAAIWCCTGSRYIGRATLAVP